MTHIIHPFLIVCARFELKTTVTQTIPKHIVFIPNIICIYTKVYKHLYQLWCPDITLCMSNVYYILGFPIWSSIHHAIKAPMKHDVSFHQLHHRSIVIPREFGDAYSNVPWSNYHHDIDWLVTQHLLEIRDIHYPFILYCPYTIRAQNDHHFNNTKAILQLYQAINAYIRKHIHIYTKLEVHIYSFGCLVHTF